MRSNPQAVTPPRNVCTATLDYIMMYFQRDVIPSTILLASEKPIIRSPQPHHFNQKLTERTSQRTHKLLSHAKSANAGIRQDQTDALASHYSWSTTSGQAAAEGALLTPRHPILLTTLERHTDPVRQREKFWRSDVSQASGIQKNKILIDKNIVIFVVMFIVWPNDCTQAAFPGDTTLYSVSLIRTLMTAVYNIIIVVKNN